MLRLSRVLRFKSSIFVNNIYENFTHILLLFIEQIKVELVIHYCLNIGIIIDASQKLILNSRSFENEKKQSVDSFNLLRTHYNQ